MKRICSLSNKQEEQFFTNVPFYKRDISHTLVILKLYIIAPNTVYIYQNDRNKKSCTLMQDSKPFSPYQTTHPLKDCDRLFLFFYKLTLIFSFKIRCQLSNSYQKKIYNSFRLLLGKTQYLSNEAPKHQQSSQYQLAMKHLNFRLHMQFLKHYTHQK